MQQPMTSEEFLSAEINSLSSRHKEDFQYLLQFLKIDAKEFEDFKKDTKKSEYKKYVRDIHSRAFGECKCMECE